MRDPTNGFHKSQTRKQEDSGIKFQRSNSIKSLSILDRLKVCSKIRDKKINLTIILSKLKVKEISCHLNNTNVLIKSLKVSFIN